MRRYARGLPAAGLRSKPTPQVRDFASPSSGFVIEWDVRPAYDFLFSLRGVMNLAHTLGDVRESMRRVNANQLNVDSINGTVRFEPADVALQA